MTSDADKHIFEGKRVLVTGGTGSLGWTLVKRLLAGKAGLPKYIRVFSRNEAKQHDMRIWLQHRAAATDEIIYRKNNDLVEFQIGDIRNYDLVAGALKNIDIVINAAALKQVPTCEFYPMEAVSTNIEGPYHIVRAIHELNLPVETVVGISSDKACQPVSVMGMTKAIQERVLITGNLLGQGTRFTCVRYGNILASRGSVIPLFLNQVQSGGPLTVTDERMTRFLLSLEDAVDAVVAAVQHGNAGEILVPRAPTARIVDIAKAIIGTRDVKLVVTGVRPGEKIHEVLVSEEECARTIIDGHYLRILPLLPELRNDFEDGQVLHEEYSSAHNNLGSDEVREILELHGLDGNSCFQEPRWSWGIP